VVNKNALFLRINDQAAHFKFMQQICLLVSLHFWWWFNFDDHNHVAG